MEWHVTGMTCAHCVHAVTQAVTAVPGTSNVSVELATGMVHVGGTPDPAAIRAAIEAEGYAVR